MPPFFALLLLLFVGSGCSALIYEIVWFQMLQLVIGSSAISLGVLLGTFMGGMCLGSLLFSRIVSMRWHPLRVYAALEGMIGAMAVSLLYLLPRAGEVYSDYVGHGMPSLLLRGVISAVCLLPPTVLMGATLPAIARWVETTREGVARLGFFYGTNIAGAVLGCLLAGFYLLRIHDVMVATYTGVTINLAVSMTALVLSFVIAHRSAPSVVEDAVAEPLAFPWPVYVAIGLSGMAALGAEVVWTRILSLLLGATVYTFSIILSVFLIGLGIGSGVGSVLARKTRHPRIAFGVCQLLLIGAIAWTAYCVNVSLPFWPIDVTLTSSPWLVFQLDIVRCMWALLPAACLWGASFPLALAGAASRGQDPGRLVGGIYAANTVGAIAGSILFSMVMISWLGTQGSQQLLMVLAACAALLALAPLVQSVRRQPRRLATGVVGFAGVLGAATYLVWSIPPVPSGLIAYGRNLPAYPEMPEFLYVGEGMNASIAVSETPDGTRNFHVSGKVVASSMPQDMRLQRMLCHVPALMHKRPKSVLIVGCGAGVTAGSFVVHPDVERIVICEIEPLIPPAAGQYFVKENYRVMDDPRLEIVYDDARHFIVTTDEKFDIITSDPIHPWVKGAAALYSQEYFELCKERLNPGGIVTQWVPLYETNLDSVRSQFATFFKVYPDGTVWGNAVDGAGYDVVLLGQRESHAIDLNALEARLKREDHRDVVTSLKETHQGSAVDLLMTYAGRGRDLQPWAEGADINRDRNLRLQYLAGLGLNRYDETFIYDTIIAYRKYPEDLIVTTGEEADFLRVMMELAASSE